MPLINPTESNPAIDARQSETALEIRRGILAGLAETGLVFVPEFTLPGGRRADLVALDTKGLITIVEIKSSVADFNADNKWFEYKEFSDKFYFASHPSVPGDIFPQDQGFILSDKHGCEIMRESGISKLAAATRKSLTLKIARTAATRLQNISDYASKLG